MAIDTVEVEVYLKWSPALKENIFPALSWLAEQQWSDVGFCPECSGVSAVTIEEECMHDLAAGHESGCRLAAMMRIFGVVPDMIDESEED